MRPTVLLFDIDGTLITTGGVGRRALELAFERVFGRQDACAEVQMSGMTDRAIVRAGLRAIGEEPTAPRIDELLEAYVGLLEAEVRAADPSTYRLHLGMREAVNAACARGFAVGLGTGNTRRGAQIKLARVTIFDRFAFGGFGCDHESRAELIRLGAERGAAWLGVPRMECRVVIIGDTPKDVAAAQEIGAECVGVGTGHFTPDVLLRHGATHAFADLTAPGALDALLGQQPTYGKPLP